LCSSFLLPEQAYQKFKLTANTILTTEATLQKLGAKEKALDELSSDKMIPVTVYLNLIQEEWTLSDAERLLEEMKDVSYNN